MTEALTFLRGLSGISFYHLLKPLILGLLLKVLRIGFLLLRHEMLCLFKQCLLSLLTSFLKLLAQSFSLLSSTLRDFLQLLLSQGYLALDRRELRSHLCFLTFALSKILLQLFLSLLHLTYFRTFLLICHLVLLLELFILAF